MNALGLGERNERIFGKTGAELCSVCTRERVVVEYACEARKYDDRHFPEAADEGRGHGRVEYVSSWSVEVVFAPVGRVWFVLAGERIAAQCGGSPGFYRVYSNAAFSEGEMYMFGGGCIERGTKVGNEAVDTFIAPNTHVGWIERYI